MSDSVGQYLNEIGTVPLLNAPKERQLSQAIEAGVEARARKEELTQEKEDLEQTKDKVIEQAQKTVQELNKANFEANRSIREINRYIRETQEAIRKANKLVKSGIQALEQTKQHIKQKKTQYLNIRVQFIDIYIHKTERDISEAKKAFRRVRKEALEQKKAYFKQVQETIRVANVPGKSDIQALEQMKEALEQKKNPYIEIVQCLIAYIRKTNRDISRADRAIEHSVELRALIDTLTRQIQKIQGSAEAIRKINEEIRKLDRIIRKGDQAKVRFIRANLRLVVSVARRYPLPPGMELLDLIQEGNLGLEHAVDKFEWRKGFKFSTYATFWIRQSIGRALDQKASLVRLPGDRSASLRAALRQTSGDGDALDDNHARLHRLTTPTSLDRTIGDDDSNELVDLIPDKGPGPELETMARAQESMVRRLLDVLEPRAKIAVQQRFGLLDDRKRSYREVGEDLGVTAEAARRLVKRALNLVREKAEELKLEEIVDAA